MDEIDGAYMLVMAAAVADFSPASVASGEKLSKQEIGSIELSLNADILKEAAASANRPEIVLGFAAETGDSLDRARQKLKDKGADYIVFNNVLDPEAGFDVLTNKVTVISASGEHELPLMSKHDVAEKLLDMIVKS